MSSYISQLPMGQEGPAAILTRNLLMDIGESTRNYQYQSHSIYVSDVEAHVDRFHAQLRFCAHFGLGFPCLYFGEVLPIDWASIVPFAQEDLWPRATYYRPAGAESSWNKPVTFPEISSWFHGLFGSTSLFNRFGGAIRFFDGPGAISSFRTRLIDFLTVRYKARHTNTSILPEDQFSTPYSATAQFSTSSGPGYKFQVITKKHGLRVHWSPAYFFSPNNVFGSPTSPVEGWLQPGRYMFGATGPSFPLEFDPATFDIPSLSHATLIGM